MYGNFAQVLKLLKENSNNQTSDSFCIATRQKDSPRKEKPPNEKSKIDIELTSMQNSTKETDEINKSPFKEEYPHNPEIYAHRANPSSKLQNYKTQTFVGVNPFNRNFEAPLMTVKKNKKIIVEINIKKRENSIETIFYIQNSLV